MRLVSLLMFIGLAGCSSLPKMSDRPTLRLSGVQTVSATSDCIADHLASRSIPNERLRLDSKQEFRFRLDNVLRDTANVSTIAGTTQVALYEDGPLWKNREQIRAIVQSCASGAL